MLTNGNHGNHQRTIFTDEVVNLGRYFFARTPNPISVVLFGLCGRFLLVGDNMKDRYYFPHDYNSRDDEKVVEMMSKLGWEGYGIFWALVEKLHEAGGWMRLDYESIAYGLRLECDILKQVMQSSLFIIEGEKFTSNRVLENLENKRVKSIKATENAMVRWGNANAMLRKKVRNANIRKEKKVFIRPTLTDLQVYFKEIEFNHDPQHFFDYYEANGWKIGKNPMKDWKATARYWKRNNFNSNNSRGDNHAWAR